jgi:integrase
MTGVVLTNSVIEALGEGRLRDARTPGLSIVVIASGRKIWNYRRRISRSRHAVKMRLGPFPAYGISEARKWADKLNRKVERGDDPCEEHRNDQRRRRMTVSEAHRLYMQAVGDGRATRAKRLNKPRTIADKLNIYNRDIAGELGDKLIHQVTERDLIKIVLRKGSQAKVRANRLAAELQVFFGWAAGLRGLEVGLEVDPSRRLGDLRFPETPRRRRLSDEELEWFLKAVAEEPLDFRRGMLLCLLTASRISEVIHATQAEVRDGAWTIPADRSKNSIPHRIALGPWSQLLMESPSQWIFPAVKVGGPRTSGWYKARDRVRARMSQFAGKPIERFTPHDFRRTARSNTRRLDVDNETAEAMLNHLKNPLERIYDGYEMEKEKAAGFRTWEAELAAIASRAGVADKLGIPQELLRKGQRKSSQRSQRRGR